MVSQLTADAAVGERVDQLLFRSRQTRKALAQSLGISPQAVSTKVLGQVKWTIDDLFRTADFFGIPVADLLPQRIEEAPESGDSEASYVPNTSALSWALRGSNPRPSD